MADSERLIQPHRFVARFEEPCDGYQKCEISDAEGGKILWSKTQNVARALRDWLVALLGPADVPMPAIPTGRQARRADP